MVMSSTIVLLKAVPALAHAAGARLRVRVGESRGRCAGGSPRGSLPALVQGRGHGLLGARSGVGGLIDALCGVRGLLLGRCPVPGAAALLGGAVGRGRLGRGMRRHGRVGVRPVALAVGGRRGDGRRAVLAYQGSARRAGAALSTGPVRRGRLFVRKRGRGRPGRLRGGTGRLRLHVLCLPGNRRSGLLRPPLVLVRVAAGFRYAVRRRFRRGGRRFRRRMLGRNAGNRLGGVPPGGPDGVGLRLRDGTLVRRPGRGCGLGLVTRVRRDPPGRP